MKCIIYTSIALKILIQMIKLRKLVSALKSSVVPPSIKGGNVTMEISALINTVIKLECETRGLPVPAITWYKDSQPITSSSQALYVDKGQFLHIPRAQVSDSATYTCRVANVAGTAEKSFHVDVYGKEKNMCFNHVFLSVFSNMPTFSPFTYKVPVGLIIFCVLG